MSKGIVYIVRNPAFMHVFKIGYTEKNSVELRGLNIGNVPEDYQILFSFECENPREPRVAATLLKSNWQLVFREVAATF